MLWSSVQLAKGFFIHIVLEKRKRYSYYLQAVKFQVIFAFFFCFCIFSGFFFLQWANNQKKKTQKQQQQESYFEAGGLEDLILLPLYSLFSFPESSVVQGGLWAEEIRPQSSEAAQSRDFWPSRFPHSLLPAPNPTRTHFTAPTFNPPNATKSAN